MPLVFRYSDPRGDEEPAVVVDLGTAVVRHGTLAIEQSAELGDAGISGITIDDPGGTLDFAGYRGFRIEETSAPSNSRWVWAGVIGNQTISRGGSERPSLRLDADRAWSLDLVDQSWSLSVSVVTGTDGIRPAETAEDRLRWLLGSRYVRVRDLGNVSYPTDAMDACDYRLQTAKDVINDCALPGGYNYWADRLEGTGGRAELFFMHPDSTLYSTTARISNVLGDVDSTTTFVASSDAKLVRSPSRITYRAIVPYSGGTAIATNETTGAQFAYVDRVAPLANVKTQAKALVIANRFLADNDEQDERITCSTWVPAAHVNDIRHGHRMQVRFSHLPGYEIFRWVRVLRRVVAQEDASPDGEWYRIGLELVPIRATVSVVYGFLAAREAGDDNVPVGWTLLAKQNPATGAENNNTAGVYIAQGPGDTGDPQSYEWVPGGLTSYLVTAATQLRGDIRLGASGAVGMIETGFGLTPSITCIAAAAGIILAALRIENFDSGAGILTPPTGFVTIYQETPAHDGISRDQGAVSFGYLPVSGAGSYTLTWTMSNQFNWSKIACAVFVPLTSVEHVQDAPGTLANGSFIDNSFPDPL